jgi:hypothetical protein
LPQSNSESIPAGSTREDTTSKTLLAPTMYVRKDVVEWNKNDRYNEVVYELVRME